MQLPPELLNQIAVVLELMVTGCTALVVAFWIGLTVWTFRDIRSRTRDLFAWILATVLVLVAGPVGLLLYLLLRPRETVAQVYDRQLEEEALLRDITARRACPKCQTVTEPEWLICPQCRTQLRRACTGCSKPLELGWVVCPYCATSVPKKSRQESKPYVGEVQQEPPLTSFPAVGQEWTLDSENRAADQLPVDEVEVEASTAPQPVPAVHFAEGSG